MSLTEEQYRELQQRMQANAGMQADAPKPKRRNSTMSESEIERICTQILIHDSWRALKTDPVSDRRRGKGFGELGMADYLYIRYLKAAMIKIPTGYAVLKEPASETLWIEWKCESGKPAPHQLAWHEQERAKGALTLVAGVDFPATVEGFADWYSASGLRRTR